MVPRDPTPRSRRRGRVERPGWSITLRTKTFPWLSYELRSNPRPPRAAAANGRGVRVVLLAEPQVSYGVEIAIHARVGMRLPNQCESDA